MDFTKLFRFNKGGDKEGRRLKDKLRNEVRRAVVEQHGEKHLKKGLGMLVELMELTSDVKATPDTLEAFAAGMLFHQKLAERMDEDDELDDDRVNMAAAMAVGMVYVAAEEMRTKEPIDHGHGGEPIFRKRGDGTPFCIVCDEDVTEEEVTNATKK